MPLPNDFADQNCSVARTLEVIGERWSMLLLRDAFRGVRRFDAFQSSLGISRNVLAARLARLVELGVLRRVLYNERPERYEYRLTERGLDLFPVLMAMIDFGDRHAAPEGGPPMIFHHRGECGGPVNVGTMRCETCGEPMTARTIRNAAGPGFNSPIGSFAAAE